MEFCSQLCTQLLMDGINKSSQDNVVLSPFSYNVILNMIAEGSTGPLLKEMLEILGCKGPDDLNYLSAMMMNIAADRNQEIGRGPVIQCLNGAWIDQKYRLEPSFEGFLWQIFEAEIKHADFKNKGDEIVKEANEWAKAATRGLVTDVLKRGDVTPWTKLILGNALYFKGTWEEGFDRYFTRHEEFYLLNGGKIWVPFMTGCTKYSSNTFAGFDLVKIPYKTGGYWKNFSMYIFLPHERNGLWSLLEKAASDSKFFQYDFPFPKYNNFEAICIPKFKFSYYTDGGLEKIRQMGFRSTLGMDVANLGTRYNEFLNVTKAVQKAFVEIDETGTEAAAVTFFGGVQSCLAPPPIPKVFMADHPFMFMIREEQSKLVLFTGAVLNPLA